MRWSRIWSIVLLIILCFPGVVIAASDEAVIVDLINDLKSANYGVALKATNALVAKGPDVLPYLEGVILHDDDWNNRYQNRLISPSFRYGDISRTLV